MGSEMCIRDSARCDEIAAQGGKIPARGLAAPSHAVFTVATGSVQSNRTRIVHAGYPGIAPELAGNRAGLASATRERNLANPVIQMRTNLSQVRSSGCFRLGVLSGPFDEFAVDEGRAGTEQGDEVGSVDGAPAVLRCLDELERHRQPCGPRAGALGDLGPVPDSGEGGLDRVGRAQMHPVLGGVAPSRTISSISDGA